MPQASANNSRTFTIQNSAKPIVNHWQKSGKSKTSRPLRIYSAGTIFFIIFVCGLDLNLIQGALFCIDELRSDEKYEDRNDLPNYVAEFETRSNVVASYYWFAPLLIFPVVFLNELGGADMVKKNYLIVK